MKRIIERLLQLQRAELNNLFGRDSNINKDFIDFLKKIDYQGFWKDYEKEDYDWYFNEDTKKDSSSYKDYSSHSDKSYYKKTDYSNKSGVKAFFQGKEFDPYKALEISSGATLEEIEKAYKRLVKKYHPDKYNTNEKDKEDSTKIMKMLNIAYETLKKKTS